MPNQSTPHCDVMNQLVIFLSVIVLGTGYVIKDKALLGEDQLRQTTDHFNATNGVHTLLSRGYYEEANRTQWLKSKPSRVTNVLQLVHMLTCMTGRSGIDYNNYGCYCGLGGEGTPVDQVDKCCQNHDNCYNKVEKQGCSWLNLPHLVVYSYKCDNKQVTCYDKEKSCDRTTCDCDRDLAICLSTAPYNNKYKNYPNKKC